LKKKVDQQGVELLQLKEENNELREEALSTKGKLKELQENELELLSMKKLA